MLWIISGPSSVGKSTFIKSEQFFALTGVRADAPVLKPKNQPGLDPRLLGEADCFVHYNILRPVSLFAKREANAQTPDDQFRARSTQFEKDPWWTEFSARTGDKRAVVLVANRGVILHRVANRRGYKVEYWRALYQKLNLPDIYRAWCSELERNEIPFVFADATASKYKRIDSSAAFEIIDRDSQ